jgi:quercetin dioxygenase-like cupin family protein
MEIRRFGVGNRRPEGPPGSTGVAGQVIHADARGTVSELAFARRGAIEPHASPNSTWFVVIEGGGMVEVGDEQARVAAGEAILWPADVPHAAWTELSEMRALVVELSGPDDAHLRGILAGRPLAIPTGDAVPGAAETPVAKADGELAASPADARRAAAEGEPI